MKKVLVGSAAVVVVGLVVLVVLIGLASRDIAPPDTSDLAVERVELAPEENAYTFFLQAGELLQIPDDQTFMQDYLNGKEVDLHVVSKFVADNREALEEIERGLNCSVCRPPVMTSFVMNSAHHEIWREIGQVLAVATRHARLEGRIDSAIHRCISHLRFANLIQADPGSIIDYVISMGLLKSGLTQARDLAHDAEMIEDEFRTISSCLDSLGPFHPGLVRAVKAEYLLIANTVDQIRDGELSLEGFTGVEEGFPGRLLSRRQIPGYFFQPNKTKLLFADLYRGVIANASGSYSTIQPYSWKVVCDSGDDKMTLITRPNGVGRMLCTIAMVAPEALFRAEFRVQCDLAATQILIACQIYRIREGKLPENLGSLVPRYLDAVPADPYDGKPFRYDPTRKIIYSVGRDLKDSGGLSKAADQGSAGSLHHRKSEPDLLYRIGTSDETSEEQVWP